MNSLEQLKELTGMWLRENDHRQVSHHSGPPAGSAIRLGLDRKMLHGNVAAPPFTTCIFNVVVPGFTVTEWSTSAIVVHHTEAKYFNVR